MKAADAELPILLVTAWTSLETAVQLVKEGAADYLAKPWDDEKLALQQRELLLETALRRSPAAVVLTDGRERVIYSNPEARQLLLGGEKLDGTAPCRLSAHRLRRRGVLARRSRRTPRLVSGSRRVAPGRKPGPLNVVNCRETTQRKGASMRRVLSLLTLLLLPRFPAAAQEESPPVFIDTIDVNVVNVEVFVTDKDGRRVSGLGREDFELYEDGKPVEITNFYAETRQDPALDDVVEMDPLVSVPELPPERPEEQTLYLVVYVDHFNLRPADRKRVLAELGGFLEDRLRLGDRIMLVGYKGSIDVVQSFTTDLGLLQDGLRKMEKFATHRQVDDADRRRTMLLMNQAVAATQRDPPDLETAYNHVRSYVQGVRHGLRRSAAALQATVQSLGGLPGRKALVYISNGLPMRPGEDLYQHLLDAFGSDIVRNADPSLGVTDPSMEMLRENQSHLFNSIVRDANAHQVTLYPLDARGVGGESSLSAAYGDLSMGSGGVTALDTIRTQGLQEPLLRMAAGTGGRAALNTSNFDGALAWAARDFDTFYSLGYRSPHGGDGAYREIKVRVKRAGLVVRHRTGFVDKPQSERVADRTLSSLLLELGKNPLDISVDFGQPQKEGRNRYVLPVLVRVPIRGLTLLPQGGTNEGRLRFYVVVRDDEDGVSDPHDEELPVSIPASSLAAARKQEIGWGVNLLVREGLPTIAVGVWDELSGLESFVHKEVRVGPKPKKKKDRSGR